MSSLLLVLLTERDVLKNTVFISLGNTPASSQLDLPRTKRERQRALYGAVFVHGEA